MLGPELAVSIVGCVVMTVCGSVLETGSFHFINYSLLFVEMRGSLLQFVSQRECSEIHAKSFTPAQLLKKICGTSA